MQYLEGIFKEGDLVVFEKQNGKGEITEIEGRVVSVLTGEIPKNQPKEIYTYPVLAKFGSFRGHRTFTHDGRLVADGVINLRLKFPREEKPVYKITMYKPFEVGDEVVSSINIFGEEHDKGTVVEITDSLSSKYIVRVIFDNSKHSYFYSVDGIYCDGQQQTLFHLDDFNIISDKAIKSDKTLSLQPAPEFKIIPEACVTSKNKLDNTFKAQGSFVDFGEMKEAVITTNRNNPFYYPKEEYPIPNLLERFGNETSTFKWHGDVLEVKEEKSKEAFKDDAGKLFYEIDFAFITQIAERMASNKSNGKYEPFNWKRPMSDEGITKILMSGWRHMIEVMQGNYEDDGRPFGHIEGVVSNLMIANHHLRKPKKVDINLLRK